jgi:triosephosphate isomerase
MDKKLFVANWKSHKTKEEAIKFFEYLRDNISHIDLSNKEIIIAVPFTLLAKAKYLVDEFKLPVKLSSQNVSSFPEGAYTGEINAKQVREFADYTIVGHSERKRYFHESESDVENKIKEAKEVGLKVIQCIQDENSQLHKDSDILAFEPPNSISTFGVGEPDDPKDIEKVFSKLSEELSGRTILYGGSVDENNVKTYADISTCGGFLIGGASLDPMSFISLLSQW